MTPRNRAARNAFIRLHIICQRMLRLGCAPHAAPGDWGSGDDRRMLRALLASGAAEEWQPDWGAVVPERTAAQALPGPLFQPCFDQVTVNAGWGGVSAVHLSRACVWAHRRAGAPWLMSTPLA